MWRIPTGRVAMGGWSLGPNGGEPPDWILAFDREGRLIGYTRPLIDREPVARGLSARDPLIGFRLPARFAKAPYSEGDLAVLAVDEGKSLGACRVGLRGLSHPAG